MELNTPSTTLLILHSALAAYSSLTPLYAVDYSSIPADVSDCLEEMLAKLAADSVLHSVTRRHLLTERIVQKDLSPLIRHASPDVHELRLLLRQVSSVLYPRSRLLAGAAVRLAVGVWDAHTSCALRLAYSQSTDRYS